MNPTVFLLIAALSCPECAARAEEAENKALVRFVDAFGPFPQVDMIYQASYREKVITFEDEVVDRILLGVIDQITFGIRQESYPFIELREGSRILTAWLILNRWPDYLVVKILDDLRECDMKYYGKQFLLPPYP